MIPAAAYLCPAEQTRRLCLADDDPDATRRTIRKLVLHFSGSGLPDSWHRLAEANLALVDPADAASYALRCLAAVARVYREYQTEQELLRTENEQYERLIAQIAAIDLAADKLADIDTRINDAVAVLIVGER